MAFGGPPIWTPWNMDTMSAITITIAVLCEAYPQFIDFITQMSYISTGYRDVDGAVTIGPTKFMPVMPPWDLSGLSITGAISLVDAIDMNYILTEWLQRYTNSQVGMWVPSTTYTTYRTPPPPSYLPLEMYKRVMEGISRDMVLATKAALPPAPEPKPECVERDIEI